MKRMHVMIAGAYVQNVIKTPTSTIERIGGIHYNVNAFCELADSILVTPCSMIGQDLAPELLSEYRNYRGKVDLSLLQVTDRPSRVSQLVYDGLGERTQTVTNSAARVSLIEPFEYANLDAVLVNYIDGNEIPSEFLDELTGRGFSGMIYVDIHNLVRFVREDGAQIIRDNVHLPDLVARADYVQMNRGEAQAILKFDYEASIPLIALLASKGALRPRKGLIITLDREGVIFVDTAREQVRTFHLPVMSVDAADPTGCGDVFSARFLLHVLSGGRVLDAIAVANVAAALHAEAGCKDQHRHASAH